MTALSELYRQYRDPGDFSYCGELKKNPKHVAQVLHKAFVVMLQEERSANVQQSL